MLALLPALSAALASNYSSDCLLEGFWQFPPFVVRFHKVSHSNWNVSYYPPNNEWYYPGQHPVPFTVGMQVGTDQAAARAPLFYCSGGRTDASAPYASPPSMAFGEMTHAMWAGLPAASANATNVTWTWPVDVATWDETPNTAPPRCAVAASVPLLVGQSQSYQRSGGCDDRASFGRLTPDLAPLDQAGYAEVAASKFYDGMAIFIRRYLASRDWVRGGALPRRALPPHSPPLHTYTSLSAHLPLTLLLLPSLQAVADAGGLAGLLPWYVGDKAEGQTFAHLVAELETARWVDRSGAMRRSPTLTPPPAPQSPPAEDPYPCWTGQCKEPNRDGSKCTYNDCFNQCLKKEDGDSSAYHECSEGCGYACLS